jgi:hypothetical protein
MIRDSGNRKDLVREQSTEEYNAGASLRDHVKVLLATQVALVRKIHAHWLAATLRRPEEALPRHVLRKSGTQV